MNDEEQRQAKQPHIAIGAEAGFAEAGHALFALVRLLGRPLAWDIPASGAGRAIELSRIMVVQAVEAAHAAGTDSEVSIGAVAARLAIDPSTASRLVADTIADGYVSAMPAPSDARRRRLALTDTGRALATDARRFQGDTFAAATADWPEAARREFARRFIAFAAALSANRERPDSGDDDARA